MKIKWLNFKWFKRKKKKNVVILKRGWDEITLKEYFELLNIITDKTLDETEMIDKLILLLTSTTPLQLSQVTQSDYIKLINGIKFVFVDPITKFPKNKLTINDKHFDVDIKLDTVVAGQYMMLQNIMKLEDFEERIKKSIGVFIRPKDSKWGEFDYDENVEYLFNNISIIDALSLSAFFLLTQKRLLKHFQTYMNKEMKREKKRLKNNLK